MKELSNIDIVILGLIAEKPRYGYQIETVVQARGLRQWTEIGFSSIYYVLTRLEKLKLLDSKIEHRGAIPPRKIYRINKKGREILKKEIIRLISNPKKAHSELDLGIANLPVLSKEKVVDCLKEYLAELEHRKEQVQNIFKTDTGAKTHFWVKALFTHTLSHIDTEVKWVKKFINTVEKEYQPEGTKKQRSK